MKFYHITYKSTSPTAGGSEVLSVNYTENSAVIENLSPWTEYGITIQSENVAGRGPSSDLVMVKTHALGLCTCILYDTHVLPFFISKFFLIK